MNSILRRRRAAMGALSKTPILPSEYKQVEWIGVTKGNINSYYLTTKTVTEVKKVVAEISVFEAASDSYIVVGRKSGNYLTYAYATLDNMQGSYFRATPTVSKGETSPFQEFTFVKTNSSYGSGTLGMLSYQSAQFVAGTGMKTCQLFDAENNMLFDGIMCYEKATGEIGMFDSVTQAFVAGVGSGRTKGADV